MITSPLAVARGCMQAYVTKDRAAIEALIAEDYYFTSPIDNALDRNSYFVRCWPNSKAMTEFDYIYQAENEDRAFIVYEAHTSGGKSFRNSEVHTVRNGKLIATEVYFGWDLPHKAPQGGFIENEDQHYFGRFYSRCFSLHIHFRQCGHRCGGGRAMSSRMAWRTAGKVGCGGGPLILFFPRLSVLSRRCWKKA